MKKHINLRKYLVISKLPCFYLRMAQKKNLYGLQNEFDSEEEAHRYLLSQKFVRDPYVPSYWYNDQKRFDAHTAHVNELGGLKSYQVTYWAPHIEAKRDTGELRRQIARNTKLTHKLELVGADYATE